MRPKISVIFPVFNEEKRVLRNLIKTYSYLESLNIPYEIIVVDDGSKDGTVKIIKELIEERKSIVFFSLKKNIGKGGAIRYGVKRSKGKYLFFSDIDLSVPISFIPKFTQALDQGYDIAIASRRKKGSIVMKKQHPLRQTLGHVFTKLSTFIFDLEVTDVTCGFKAFSSKSAKTLFSQAKINRWAFDTEILYLAKKNGLRLRELPVHWSNQKGTKVNLIRDIPFTLLDLITIRLSSY